MTRHFLFQVIAMNTIFTFLKLIRIFKKTYKAFGIGCNFKSITYGLLTLKQLIRSKENKAPKTVKTKGIFFIHAARNSESTRLKL